MINPHNRLYSSRSRGTVRSRSLWEPEVIGSGCGCLLAPFVLISGLILALFTDVILPLAIIAGSVYLILYILRSFGLV